MIALRFGAAAFAAVLAFIAGSATYAQGFTPGIACPNGQAVTGHTLQSGIVCGIVGPAGANLLLNPSMEIDQANEGASVPLTSGTPAFVLDGWSAGFHSASATISAQRVSDSPAGFANSLKLTVGTGASVAAGDYLFIRQPIEANNLTALALGTSSAATVCVSFQVKSSIGSYAFSAALQNFAGTRSYPLNFTIPSSATWTPVSACFQLDTGGTWVTSGTAGGAYLIVTAAAGSTFQGTVNTWNVGNFYGTSSDTNTILSTSSATFQVTGVKLEASPVATLFVRRPFGEEIALCQRQFEKSFSPGTVLASATQAGTSFIYMASSGLVGGQTVIFKQSKRTVPTMTLYSPHTGATGFLFDGNNGTDVTGNLLSTGANGFAWYGAASAAAGSVNLQAQWAADARLAP